MYKPLNLFVNNKNEYYDCKTRINDYVKDLYETARKCFVAWKKANKPRNLNNSFFNRITASTARFEIAMRFIKIH